MRDVSQDILAWLGWEVCTSWLLNTSFGGLSADLVKGKLDSYVKMLHLCSLVREMMLWCLGLPETTPVESLTWDPSKEFAVKRSRFFFRNIHTQSPIEAADVFDQSDFKPLITMPGNRVPVGPFLRVRHELKYDMLHLGCSTCLPVCSMILTFSMVPTALGLSVGFR